MIQRKQWIKWATEHIIWDKLKWKSLIFSVEYIIQYLNERKRLTIRSTCEERDSNINIQHIMRYGPQINVQKCFRNNGVGKTKRIEGSLDSKYTKEAF